MSNFDQREALEMVIEYRIIISMVVVSLSYVALQFVPLSLKVAILPYIGGLVGVVGLTLVFASLVYGVSSRGDDE